MCFRGDSQRKWDGRRNGPIQPIVKVDRVGLTDLFEGISVSGNRFYVVEHLFASGKVSQDYRGSLRLLHLGESVAQSDLKPFSELIQLLADAGIVIPEDGIGASCKTQASSWRIPTSRCSATKSLGCTCSG